jgi:hypothetical protein
MRQCKRCNSARASRYYQQHKAGTPEQREYERQRLIRRHGLTPESFAAILHAQDGVCAICAGPLDKPMIDHDHAHCAGSYGCAECVRGILCLPCNTGIGLFREDVSLLKRASRYIAMSKPV